jgi:GNAT superfamily N-acetyltransferase
MIRPATPDDVPTIMRFIRELAEYEHAADEVLATEEDLRRDLFGDPDSDPDPDPDGERMRPAVFAHIAEDAGGLAVGFAVWFLNYSTWRGRHGIYLEDLYVTPSARRGGYGHALLTELARIAVERGYGRFEWAVLDWNEPALAFYRSLGAKPQDEWTVQRLDGAGLRSLAGIADAHAGAIVDQDSKR